MTPFLKSFRVVVAVVAIIAVPAVAPPPGPTQAQLLRTYNAEYAQKLTVSKAVSVTTISNGVFSATDSIQTLASNGTNYDWAKLVLLDGHWPQTDNNVTVILRWMRQENGVNDWWNRANPLNNGYGAPGAGGTGSNSDLVRGALNAADALTVGAGGGYGGIVAALAADSSPDVTAAAIWASNWSTSHYANGTHWSTAPVPVVKAPASAW
jgi:hypothetical protein